MSVCSILWNVNLLNPYANITKTGPNMKSFVFSPLPPSSPYWILTHNLVSKDWQTDLTVTDSCTINTSTFREAGFQGCGSHSLSDNILGLPLRHFSLKSKPLHVRTFVPVLDEGAHKHAFTATLNHRANQPQSAASYTTVHL